MHVQIIGGAEEAFSRHYSSYSFGIQAVASRGALHPHYAGRPFYRPSRDHASRQVGGNDGEGANAFLSTKG